MRKTICVLVLGVAGMAALTGTVLATTGSGFTATTLAKGQLDAIDAHVQSLPAEWQAKLKSKGVSDLYVQSNVWTAGGHTGWHTHPGPSLIIVTAGTITAYEGGCEGQEYTTGMAFVDTGGGDVHILRNEGAVEARTIAVQIIPTGAVRRIDTPAPEDCGF